MGRAARAAGYSTLTASPSSAPARAARGPVAPGRIRGAEEGREGPEEEHPGRDVPESRDGEGVHRSGHGVAGGDGQARPGSPLQAPHPGEEKGAKEGRRDAQAEEGQQVAGQEAILRAQERRREHLAHPGVEGDQPEGEAGGLVRVVVAAGGPAHKRPVERPPGVGVDVQRPALDHGVGQGQAAVRVVVRAAVDEGAVGAETGQEEGQGQSPLPQLRPGVALPVAPCRIPHRTATMMPCPPQTPPATTPATVLAPAPARPLPGSRRPRWGAPRPRPPHPPAGERAFRRRDLAVAGGLVLLALLLRLPGLESAPGWDGDEGYNLDIACSL